MAARVKDIIKFGKKGKNTQDVFSRTVGLRGVVVISLSSMFGSGLFVMPSVAAYLMGPSVWLAFLLASLVVLPAAVSKSELSAGMPASGGSYVHFERTYGPLIGTISGLGLWGSFLLKAAFALIGFTAYFRVVTTYFSLDWKMYTTSILALILITAINILGVKKVKAVQAPIIFATLLLLTIVTIKALFSPQFDPSVPIQGLSTGSVWSIVETTGFVFVAYAGVTKIGAIAGEVKDPEENLPLGIFISLAVATALYTLLTFVMMATLPPQWWVGSNGVEIENPVFIFVETLMGTKIGVFASVLAIFTMISMALAGILGSSRFLFAMSRDNLLPQAFEDVNARYETPHFPIILTGLVMGVLITYVPIADVVKLASGFNIMIFILINATVIVLRKTSNVHKWDPAYKSPFYPYLQIWGIVSGAVLISFLGVKALLGAGLVVLIGCALYYGYGKKHYLHQWTPFHSFTNQFKLASPTEHDRRLAAFHAADFGEKNHLTLKEFQNALHALGYQYTQDESRAIFHNADENADGVIDIDEFFSTYEVLEESSS